MSTKTWFITGASSGFGDAFARHAIAQGYNVVATARDPSRLAAIAALAPERVLVQRLDVTQPGEAETAIEAAIARFGRIDVLINNAGYGIVGAAEETPEAELRAQMETNFFGAVAVTQAALPILRDQKSGRDRQHLEPRRSALVRRVQRLLGEQVRAGGLFRSAGRRDGAVRGQGADRRAG